jgi:hypothetical protein
VSAADAPALDRAALLAAFEKHGAKFVLVGGIAGQVYGATRLTKDLDICPDWSSTNLERVAAALRDLGARMKIGEGSIELLEVAVDAKTLANMEIVPWRTQAGDVDVLLGIPSASRSELARYDQLMANATIVEVDGFQIAVASLAEIIRSKEIANRQKDREALQELRVIEGRLRERQTGRDAPEFGSGL